MLGTKRGMEEGREDLAKWTGVCKGRKVDCTDAPYLSTGFRKNALPMMNMLLSLEP